MFRPPQSPHGTPRTGPLSTGSLLASYALLAAFPVLLWMLSNPIAGGAVLVATVSVALVARELLRLRRCFSRCGGFSLDLGKQVRVTIAQQSIDE